MRVALLAPLFESVPPRLYGGTERVVDNLSKGLIRAGCEVTVFASGDSTTVGEVVPVIDQALRLREKVADFGAYNMRMLMMVAQRGGDFDVIHNHNDYWMLPLTEMLKVQVPFVTTLHGRMDLPDQPAAFSSFKKGAYVSISDSQRFPYPDLRWIETVHNGVNMDHFEFHDRPGNYLAFLGRIAADKRPEWAIEIAKRSGVPLKIAAKVEGSVGRAYYDEFVGPSVDGHFIEYVGEISEKEKSEFLGNALALVFPIDWPEPFGLVMIEALACGTPVLARPCGSVTEILCEGITGYCDLDIKKLANRVHDASKIDRHQCRKWVERRFSLERMTEDYIHVYRSLAQYGKGTSSDHRRRNFLYSVERTPDRNS